MDRYQIWFLSLDGLAVILLIIGGSIGAGSALGIALIVIGVVLIQIAWIPVILRRRRGTAARRL